MTVVRTIEETRAALKGAKQVGFVPTMGAFHEGHTTLMEASVSQNTTTVVSLFVNPTQFGPNEDFETYPRNETLDFEIAERAGVSIIFAPSAEEMYKNSHTTLHVSGVTEHYEGAARPGHFDGVALIVHKLFNIVRPQNAYFGLKDLQQCAVINTMVRDLSLDVVIHTIETVRESSGLALSSRNKKLAPEELEIAPMLFACLSEFTDVLRECRGVVSDALETVTRKLTSLGFSVDYLDLVDPATMSPQTALRPGLRLIVAAKLGVVRLLDNVPIV